MTPYQEAFDFIQLHPGSGSSIGMSKLILSIYNRENAFSLGECLRSFDKERDQLALRVIKYYLDVGENDDLRTIGQQIFEMYPNLLLIANGAIAGKAAVKLAA